MEEDLDHIKKIYEQRIHHVKKEFDNVQDKIDTKGNNFLFEQPNLFFNTEVEDLHEKLNHLNHLKDAYEKEVCSGCLLKIRKIDNSTDIVTPIDEIKVLLTEIGKT